MRLSHELKKRSSAKNLLNEKKELGIKFAKMSKLGNPLACFNKNDLTYINSYCRTNIPDLEVQNECIKPKQFCYICCDNEIGPINKMHLDCCYNRCDMIPQATCSSFVESFGLKNFQGIAAPMVTPNPPILPSTSFGLPLTPGVGVVPSPFPPVDPIVAIPQEY